MNKDSNTSSSRRLKLWNKTTITELLFLAITLWIVNFLFFKTLGLYEDDYAFISQPLGWQLSDLINYLRIVLTWPQGRPIGTFIPHFLAFLGGKLGGLSTVYFFSFLIQTTNTYLFYFLLKRIGLTSSALLGALAFGLFPADTTHILLMHSLGLHTALTFLLLASHFYLSDHKTLAYFFSLGSLLTYESPYMVFLAIPLLNQRWNKELVKEAVRHIIIWLGILIVVVVIRALIGESRIETIGSKPTDIISIFGQTMASLTLGPIISVGMFGYGPGRTLFHWNSKLTFIFLGFLPFLGWIISQVKTDFIIKENEYPFNLAIKMFSRKKKVHVSISHPQIFKLLAASLVMLSLSYGFSFTHFPPTALFGRMTSVHLAAAFGGSLLFACITSLFLTFAKSRFIKAITVIILTFYLSLMVTYRFSIQLDFIQAWLNERTFWTNIITKIPDISDGTIIFVIDQNLPATHYILTNSWADPIMLTQIFKFPKNWETPPRLFVVPQDWMNSIVEDGDKFLWKVPAATWKSHWETLPISNLILIEMEESELVRRYGSIIINNKPFQLKTISPNNIVDLKEGFLFSLLIQALK